MDDVLGLYIPAWIEAIATTLAFLAAGIAVAFSWRALRAERDRDERAAAAGLSAWWVKGSIEGKEEAWGVLISNKADFVFKDVAIHVVGNDHDKGRTPIELRTMPPGRYFVESNSHQENNAWGEQIPLRDSVTMAPLTLAKKRFIQRMSYSDGSGRSWKWTPSRGLERA